MRASHNRIYWLPVILGVVFWVVSVGCPPPEAACEQDTQCAKGMICQASRCVIGCRQRADCAPSEVCFQNICTTQTCQPGNQQECYDGPANTAGVGLCKKGKQTCLASKTWGPCLLQQLPQSEVCDKEDNDCDGKVDNLAQGDCSCPTPGTARKCYTGPTDTDGKGVCTKGGFQYCTAQNTWSRCLGQVLPTPEVCDGLDNDCNGQIDDNQQCESCQKGTSRPCYTGPLSTTAKGACKSGLQSCQDGRWSACIGEIKPIPEVCDGKDNDCDGAIDNLPGSTEPSICPPKTACKNGETRSCGTNLPDFCKAQETCANEKWGPCRVNNATKEVCDGKDNDCNGRIDDGLTCPLYDCRFGTDPKYEFKAASLQMPVQPKFEGPIWQLAFQVQGGKSILSLVFGAHLYDFSFAEQTKSLTYAPPPNGAKVPRVSPVFLFTKKNRLFNQPYLQENTFLVRDQIGAAFDTISINNYPSLQGRNVKLLVHDPYHSQYDWSLYALFWHVTSNHLELHHLYQERAGGAFNAQGITLQSMPGDTAVIAVRPGLDGKHMAFGTEKGSVHVFQSLQGMHVAQNAQGQDFVATAGITVMAFRPEPKAGGQAQLAVGDGRGNIWLFKSVKNGADTTYQEIGRLIVFNPPTGEKSELVYLKYSPDGAFLVASWRSGLVVLFSVSSPSTSDPNKQVSFVFDNQANNYVPPIVYHPHLHMFIVGSAKGKLYAVSCGTK